MEYVPGLFTWDKAAGRGINRTSQAGIKIKERLELLPLWAFMVYYRVTFTFYVLAISI
jgi:hypothetical protein